MAGVTKIEQGEFREKKRQYMEMPEAAEWMPKRIAATFEVSTTVAGRWRRARGLPSVKEVNDEKKRLVRQDPDYGTPGEVARYPARHLAEKYDFSTSAIARWRAEDGIISLSTTHMPTDCEPNLVLELFRKWSPPPGLKEHLMSLKREHVLCLDSE